MPSNFSRSQTFAKRAVGSERGIVSAQHRQAAEVGAVGPRRRRRLHRRGRRDLVRARRARALDERHRRRSAPWCCIGRSEDRFEVISFGGESPAGLDPGDYPLTGDGTVSDLFPWRRVVGDRNLHGPELGGRSRASSPAWKPRTAATAGRAWQRSGASRRRARPRGTAGRLVHHGQHRRRRRRPAALPGCRGRLPRRRPAPEHAVGRPLAT